MRSFPIAITFLSAALLPAQVVFPFNAQQLTAPAPQVPPEQRCTVSGQVNNAITGDPVKRATVQLTAQVSGPGTPGIVGPPGASGQGYTTNTEADGGFHFENVEPGTYTLSATRQGFLMGRFGASSMNQPGSPIVLAPSQSRTGMSLLLTPQAVIAGKILDDEGEPVASVMVQVIKAQWTRGKLRYLTQQGSTTNDLGEFRLANLSPGKYFISAQKNAFDNNATVTVAPGTAKDKPDLRPVRTYYPGTTTQDGATALEVKAGQDLTGIEFRLQMQPTFHVRGRAPVPSSEEAHQRSMVSVMPRNSNGIFMTAGQAQLKPDGSFDIGGVPAGSYTVNLMMFSGNVRTTSRANVDVGGSDVNDVVLTPTSTATLQGRVTLDGTPTAGTAPDLRSVHVNLMPADFGMLTGGIARGSVQQDGSFSIENVSPARYMVNVAAPNGTYVKAVLYGQNDVKETDLDLSGGAAGEIQVVLRYGPGEIDGNLQAGTQPPATATAVLVPQNTDNWNLRQAGIDSSGAFSLKQVPPGKYNGYVIEQLDSMLLQNPAVLKELEAKATSIEVKENDRKQVTFPLIGAADFRQLLSRAGSEAQ